MNRLIYRLVCVLVFFIVFAWRGGLGSPTEKGTFGGHTWACADLPAVDILNVIRKGQQRGGLWLPVGCSILFATLRLWQQQQTRRFG